MISKQLLSCKYFIQCHIFYVKLGSLYWLKNAFVYEKVIEVFLLSASDFNAYV